MKGRTRAVVGSYPGPLGVPERVCVSGPKVGGPVVRQSRSHVQRVVSLPFTWKARSRLSFCALRREAKTMVGDTTPLLMTRALIVGNTSTPRVLFRSLSFVNDHVTVPR